MYILHQPANRLIDSLNEHLCSNEFDNFTFAVAYAKMSGVNLIRDSILRFKAGSGVVTGIIGIDQKNTSIEALRELLHLCDQIYLFHVEEIAQTYHPKFYFFDANNSRAELIIGSNNLTNGGLMNNFEISLGTSLLYSSVDDLTIIEQAKGVISYYIDKPQFCKNLTPELVDELIQKNYIISEAIQNVRIQQNANAINREERIFGRSESMSRQGAVNPFASTLDVSTDSDVVQELDSEYEIMDDIDEAENELNTGFWKKLSLKYDVSKTSSPGQIQIPKGFKDFFPPFSNQHTTPKGGGQEETFFNLNFITPEGNVIRVNNARAIYYTPAPNHPRQNQELRFTFLNRDISDTLEGNDILVFRKSQSEDIHFVVHHIKPGMEQYGSYNGRFNELS